MSEEEGADHDLRVEGMSFMKMHHQKPKKKGERRK